MTQREIGVNLPEEKDLYAVGTVSHISQILRLSPTSVRCVVEGRRRARLKRLWHCLLYTSSTELESRYPQYRFAKHKGYGTKLHLSLIHIWMDTSEKIRLTPAWASSKLPTTAHTPTLAPSWVSIWVSWTWETPSLG